MRTTVTDCGIWQTLNVGLSDKQLEMLFAAHNLRYITTPKDNPELAGLLRIL